MNNIPLLIGMGTIGVCAASMFYVIVSSHERHKADTESRDTVGSTPQADAVAAHAPAGPVIPAAFDAALHRPPTATVSTAPAPSPATAAAPAAPAASEAVSWDMTPVAIEARKKAWAAWFDDAARQKEDRAKELRVALSADTAGTIASRANPFAAQETLTPGDQQPSPGSQSGLGGLGGAGGLGGQTAAGAAGPLDQLAASRKARQPTSLFDQPGSDPASDYLTNGLTDPVSPYELKAGDVISGVMLSGLTSESHGIVKAMVTKHVLDHATGNHILIPQGSQLVGIYQTGGNAGQQRVEVGWERVIFPAPCDQSLDLGIMPGSDESGYSGFHDITDDHFWQIAKNLLLASVFSAGIQLSQPQQSSRDGYSSQQIIAGSLGQQLGEFGMEMARRGMDIPPTQDIRNGYSFTIMVVKDIAFSHPWQAGVSGQPGSCQPSMRLASVR